LLIPEQMQLIGQPSGKSWLLFYYATSASMFMLIAVASCTSTQTFSEIYTLVAEFLSLSKTTLSMSLRDSPNFGHFVCYALLSLSLAGVFSRRHKILAPLLAGAFGVLMELVQIFIPSRDASFMDIGINVLGVAVGFGIYMLVRVLARRIVNH